MTKTTRAVKRKAFNAGRRGVLCFALAFGCLGLQARENGSLPVAASGRQWQQDGLYAGFTPAQEVTEKRTRTTKVFRNSDGSLTSQVGCLKHYRDADGRWQDVDYTIVPAPAGFQNTTNEIKNYFPAAPGTAPVRMQKDGSGFSWWNVPRLDIRSGNAVLSSSAAGTGTGASLNGGVLRYDQAYEHITEEFVALEGGIENNTIIHALNTQLSTAPDGATASFSQFIPLQQGWQVISGHGVQTAGFEADAFAIRFTNGEAASFGRIITFDAAISKDDAMLVNAPTDKLTPAQRTMLDRHVHVGRYAVRFVAGGIEVAVQLPVSWLREAGRSFPVTIDPVVTITPAGAVSTFYGPMTHWYGFQRHADLYLQSEIGNFGFITAIEYNSTTAGTAGSRPTKIHMRTTTATTLTGTAAWNSATYTGAGAQLCLDANTDQGNTTGWKLLTLTNQFTYNQGNLLIMVYDAWGGSGATKYYNIASTTARQAFRRVDGTDPGDGTATAVEDRLPEIRITYTPLYPPDNSGVTALVSPVSSFCSNSAQDVYVRVKNLGANAVNNTQVHWTVSGVPQPPVNVTTPLPNYNDSVDVLLGSVFFADNGTLPLKAWTYLPNGVPDQDATNDSLSFSITPGMQGVDVRLSPRDTTICNNVAIRFDAGEFPGNPIYVWNTGALTPEIEVTQAGTYWVKVQNSLGCVDRDTVQVAVYPDPVAHSIAIIDNGGGSFTFNVIGAQNITGYEWDFHDGTGAVTGSGAPGQQLHTFAAPGEYNVTLTLRNACGEIVITRLVKIDGTTGIDALSALQRSVKIFPNPGRNVVTITNDGSLKMKQVAIYNITGQKVYAAPVSGDKHLVDTKAFSAGIYTVMIDTDKGKLNRKLEIIR